MVERWDKAGIVAPHKPIPNFENGDIDTLWIEKEVDYTTLFAGDSTFQQLLVAENAIEPSAGLSASAIASETAAEEASNENASLDSRTLGRDEM